MASACINNIGLSPDNFLDCSPTCSYAWLTPRASLAREMPDDASSNNRIISQEKLSDLPEEPDLDLSDIADFEFRLEDPVMMLPADQLFSDGKLIPLHLPLIHRDATSSTTTPSDISSPDTPKPRRRTNSVSVADPFLYSPKAPRCSSRWKELLGLRKLYQSNNAKQDTNRASSPSSSRNGNGNVATKSIKHFLHRSSKSSNDSSVNLPLLKDTDNEPTSMSSRISLSSSSSSHDPDDLPRLSLDSEKPGKVNLNTNTNNHPRMRIVKTRTLSSDGSGTTRVGRSPVRCPADTPAASVRGVSIDSPRMNSSGKIVFHSLERSSSSPGSFNGGPRFKHRGMERSYSANVRVTPVLNVPVCSLRGSSKSGGVFGLPLFSSTQKRDGSSGSNGGAGAGAGRSQLINGKTKTDRT